MSSETFRVRWPTTRLVSAMVCLVVLGSGCDRKGGREEPAQEGGSVAPATTSPAATAKTPSGPAPLEGAAPTAESAKLGEPAPEFSLPDIDGKTVRLSDFRGKTVVLEWFNPGCPFVRASHTNGALTDAAIRHDKDGVVWLAINSSAPGKQGHGVEVNRTARQEFALGHPVLLDESGSAGRSYGAERTPHMFVVDPKGVLVYRGAIDNSPDGEGSSPTGGTLVRYVDQALAELAAGKAVSVPNTKPYGCTVKYGT